MKRFKLWFRGMFGLMLIVLVSATFAEDKPASMPKVLRVGYFGAVNSQLLAKNLGLDSDEAGIPVEWVKLESGQSIVTGCSAWRRRKNIPSALACRTHFAPGFSA